MRSASAFPLWLKYLIGFGLAWFFLPVLDEAPYSELTLTLGAWLAFTLLALFPGRRAGFPRMFGVLSVLWVLVSAGILLLLVSDLAWRDFASDLRSDDLEGVLRLWLIPYLVLYPALTVTLWMRLGAFRPLVVVTASWNILGTIFTHAHRQDASLSIMALDVLLDVAVAIYLLFHFRVKPDFISVTGGAPPSTAPSLES